MLEYGELLDHLIKTHPSLAQGLLRAHNARCERLNRYFKGLRFEGIEELFIFFSTAETYFATHAQLSSLSCLVNRARGDLELAVEAILSSAPSIVGDAMRDLMEIEFLLREFCHEPEQLLKWLAADERTLNQQFSAGALRARHAQRIGADPKDLGDTVCYKLHSQLLHVTHRPSPLGPRGVGSQQDPFVLDLCFGEVFEHNRRLLFELYQVCRVLLGTDPSLPDPHIAMPKASEAWISTQAMLGFIIAMYTAGSKKGQTAELEVDDYDPEYLNPAAAIAYHYFLTAFQILDRESVTDQEGNTLSVPEALNTVRDLCLEEIRRTITHW